MRNLEGTHSEGVAKQAKEVVATAERVGGRRIRMNIALRRAGNPATLVGTFDWARTTLGWKPVRSDLGIQIRDAWNWMRKADHPVSSPAN
jgi:UDP-glucose 4-epimerase